MNISPLCVGPIAAAGHQALHGSKVGAPNATDVEVMAWAHDHGMVVLTHDLDFGDILWVPAAPRGPA